MAELPHLNLVTIGHVDAGKSTLVGRLLYEHGEIDEQTIKNLKAEAAKIGKATFEFAFVMDQLKEERERGVTIDVSHKKFKTGKFYFTIIDAPGHRDFVKNMITGTSQADAAILVVDAVNGVQPQTKEHAFLARTLGVKQIMIAINKMDMVKYDQKAFEKAKEDVSKLLKSVGYKVEEVPFLAISAYNGDNITKKTANMPWYTGPTILETLDKLTVPPKLTDKPLRLPVQDVYTITGAGTVPVGRVETGVLKPNMKVIFMPMKVAGEVKSIEMHHEQVPQAMPGDNVGFNVRGVGKQDIRRGDVCGDPANPPTVAEEFTAQIIVLNHPSVIAAGYTPVFHCHTAQVACTVTEIVKKINPASGQVLQEKPDFIKTGDAAVIKVKPTTPMCVEKASEYPPLGRFAIRDMGQTVAAGMIIDVVPKK